MNIWPHQERGVHDVLEAFRLGYRRVCLTSPTGGGKTLMMDEIIRHFLAAGKKVVLYTNRKLLRQQLSERLKASGLDHGTRAAGAADERHLDFQVSSIQTEWSRKKDAAWGLHEADLAIIDEVHLMTGTEALLIMDAHVQEGGCVLGVTATPIGLDGIFEHLVIAGTTSELRACGALVPAIHYGPDEPDLRKLRGLREGEDLSENQQKDAMMTPTLWGRVLDWYKRLNPDNRPTILFAPSVEGSIWFAEQFGKFGIPAAHIDGQDVWRDGKLYRTSQTARADILEGSKDGSIKVICNRFVLREGIDCPWLGHGILATVFGSIQSYLQSGGRLLRAYPGLDHITIQDHGGNWHRHGSLNADRFWRLEDTSVMIAGLRAERLRLKKCKECGAKLTDGPICPECGTPNDVEPYRCPQCGMILNRPWCSCGFNPRSWKRSRPVVQTDGSLKEISGDIFKASRICTKPNGPALWERMYYRSRTQKGQRSFRAAMALFAQENHWAYPDPAWPFMPTNLDDWFRDVGSVPPERLVQKPAKEAPCGQSDEGNP